VTDHPSSEELCALYRGELLPERARAIARHVVLEGCAHCLASLPAPLYIGFELSSPPVEMTPEDDAGYDAAIERALKTTLKHKRNLKRQEARSRKAAEILTYGDLEALGKLPRRLKTGDRVDVLLGRSWAMRHENPTLMVQLAELAVHQSKRLDTRTHGVQAALDLQGRALGELGNAYRVMDQLDLAAVTLGKAREFLEMGSGEEALKARLQELEASLAADRRQFGIASNLLLGVQAFHQQKGDPQLTGRILILRGLYTGYAGELEKGIGLLQEGLSLVEEKRDPSLVYAAVHNQLLFLVDAGRYQDARRFRFENNRILRNSGGRINRARFRGLEGRMDLGMGNYSRAEMTLRDVAQELESVGRSYVSAVASLDLAVALLAQGKSAEAEEVTLAASDVFQRLRIHREGLVALSMLHSAFKLGQATVKLMQDVTAFFRRLDNDPNSLFDGRLW
jgi:tetratricopeptide (TPR) repeat protein